MKLLQTIGSILLAITISTALRQCQKASQKRKFRDEVETATNEVKKEAAEKYPNLPLSDAIQIVADEKSQQDIESKTGKEKRVAAASAFFGFYLANGRGYVEFCKLQGSDLQPYMQAFEDVHAKELARARDAIRGSQIKEDDLYDILKDTFTTSANKEVTDFATNQNISLKESCDLFSRNADKWAKDRHISNVLPYVYTALMSTD
jgi:hypothetical protein